MNLKESWRSLGAGLGGGRMEIRIPEEDFENLKYLIGRRELNEDDY
jgi:hypothetical protein